MLISDRILIEAERILLYSEVSIAEIGLSLGFADLAYFNRFFARDVGIPPDKYRDGLAVLSKG